MDFSQLGNAAAQSEDMSQVKSFERELPATGAALMRITGYVETGRHESRNPKHKPALKCMIMFELSTPKHLIEMDGKKVPQKFMLRLNKGLTAKSGFKKVFNQLNAATGGNSQHIFQMFGKPLMGEIFHNTTGEGENKKTYANLDNDGAYSFKAPSQEDPLTGEVKEIPVLELHNKLQGFLWEPDPEHISDEQYVEMWNDLFIEGEHEADKDGKVRTKNWIQESIKENIEWEGSRLQSLVEEDLDITDFETKPANLEAAAGGDAQLGI